MKSYFLILLATLTILPQFAFSVPPKVKTISGKVVNQENEPLAGVNISVEYTALGTTTDEYGKYRLDVKGHEKVRLLFEYIGYQPASHNLYFSSKPEYTLNVKMQPKILEMDAVEISEQKYEPDVSVFEIETSELRTIPDFQGDVLRAVKTLPGIGSNNEMSSTYHVHGGSSNDNLILLEGFRVPQPRQIRNSSQEGMSPLNPALLRNMQIMTGDFSVAYGEKIYSVLLTEYKQTAPREVSGEFELSLINAGLMLEGQLPNDGYWAVAARRSDTRFILNTLQTEADYNPKFYDVQTILRCHLTPRHKLNLFGIFLNNDIQVEPKEYVAQYGATYFSSTYSEFRTILEGQQRALFRTGLVGLKLESQLPAEIRMQNFLSFSSSHERDQVGIDGETSERENVDYETGSASNVTPYSSYSEYRDNRLREHLISYNNLFLMPLSTHLFQTGSQIQRHFFRDEIAEDYQVFLATDNGSVESEAERVGFRSQAKRSHTTFVLFGEDNWDVTPLLSLNYGLRAHYFTYNKNFTISPRVRVKYLLDVENWISASWGHYTQPPEYREFRDSNYNLLDNVPTQKAQKAVLSYYRKNPNETVFRAEGYYIHISELIPYNFEDIFIQYEPEYTATGNTYGLMLYLYGKLNRRLNSWFSYNYMVARQRVPELQTGTIPSPTDQRHTISLVFQDDMPEIPGMRLTTRVLFGSGYPFSAYTTEQDPETGIYYPVEYNRMGLRMAFYRRLDLGMSYERKLQNNLSYKVAFEIFNAFDFRNVLSYKIFATKEGEIQRVRNNLSRRMVNLRVTVGF